MTALEVFCYGEIGIDNIIQVPHLPGPERAVFPTGDSDHIGGAAANTAVWLARFGFRTGLAGNAIGTDAYGRELWKRLVQQPALDLSAVTRDEAVVTPFCRALVTPDAERSFLIFGYPQAPRTELSEAMLHGASFLALDLYGGEERLRAARLGHRLGLRTVIGDVIDLEHEALPLASILTNSAAFIRETYPGIDAREHAHRLQARSGGIVITTDGGREVCAIDQDGASFAVQPPEVVPIDATGAGDAFRAGLIAGLLSGEDLRTGVAWGVAAGTLKVGHLGAATHVPSLEEVVSLAATLL